MDQVTKDKIIALKVLLDGYDLQQIRDEILLMHTDAASLPLDDKIELGKEWLRIEFGETLMAEFWAEFP